MVINPPRRGVNPLAGTLPGITDARPLFRAVKLGGKIVDKAMRGNDVARVVKKLIERAGLDRSVFSAHSLRSGFLSSAAEHRADVWAMQRQSRHKNLDVLSGYIQSRNLFVGLRGRGVPLMPFDSTTFHDHRVHVLPSHPSEAAKGRAHRHQHRDRRTTEATEATPSSLRQARADVLIIVMLAALAGCAVVP